MTENLRIIEISRDGIWYTSVFENIKYGDLFRMFDSLDNTPVVGVDGSCVFKATSDAYEKDGSLVVDTDEVDTV